MIVPLDIQRRTASSSPMETILHSPNHGRVNFPLFLVRFFTNMSVLIRYGERSFVPPNRFFICSFTITLTLVASSSFCSKVVNHVFAVGGRTDSHQPVPSEQYAVNSMALDYRKPHAYKNASKFNRFLPDDFSH